jgi:hypothetical protein
MRGSGVRSKLAWERAGSVQGEKSSVLGSRCKDFLQTKMDLHSLTLPTYLRLCTVCVYCVLYSSFLPRAFGFAIRYSFFFWQCYIP